MTRLFLSVVNMSISASAVILAVLLARFALQKAPKKYSYLLWIVVGFRLAVPFSLKSALSLFNLKLLSPAAPGAVREMTVSPTVPVSPLPAAPEGIPAISPSQPLSPNLAGNITPIEPAVQTLSFDWAAFFAGLWLVGMILLALWAVVGEVRLRRSVATATRYEGNVWQSEHVRSPFLLGLVRPRIYIPYGLPDQARNYVLTHERCHLHRGDPLFRRIAFALLMVHWFNPLVWLSFCLMGKDMELSCDEKVLQNGQVDATGYSSTLLAFAANRRHFAAAPLAFGETGVKSRIKNALNWKSPKLTVTLTAALILLVLASCGLDPLSPLTKQSAPLPVTDRNATGFYTIERLDNTSAQLRFVDCVHGVDHPLCEKEGCTHSGPDCPAFVQLDSEFEDLPTVLVADDTVLLLRNLTGMSTTPNQRIQKWSPEEGLTTLYETEYDETLPWPFLDTETPYYVQEGKLLFTTDILTMNSGATTRLHALALDTGRDETLWKVSGQTGSTILAGGISNGLVLQRSQRGMAFEEGVTYEKLDLTTRKLETLYESPKGEWIQSDSEGLWVLSQDHQTLVRIPFDGSQEHSFPLNEVWDTVFNESTDKIMMFQTHVGNWLRFVRMDDSSESVLFHAETGEVQPCAMDAADSASSDFVRWWSDEKLVVPFYDPEQPEQISYAFMQSEDYLNGQAELTPIPRQNKQESNLGLVMAADGGNPFLNTLAMNEKEAIYPAVRRDGNQQIIQLYRLDFERMEKSPWSEPVVVANDTNRGVVPILANGQVYLHKNEDALAGGSSYLWRLSQTPDAPHVSYEFPENLTMVWQSGVATDGKELYFTCDYRREDGRLAKQSALCRTNSNTNKIEVIHELEGEGWLLLGTTPEGVVLERWPWVNGKKPQQMERSLWKLDLLDGSLTDLDYKWIPEKTQTVIQDGWLYAVQLDNLALTRVRLATGEKQSLPQMQLPEALDLFYLHDFIDGKLLVSTADAETNEENRWLVDPLTGKVTPVSPDSNFAGENSTDFLILDHWEDYDDNLASVVPECTMISKQDYYAGKDTHRKFSERANTNRGV